ncbi:MAG: YcxB family protein [Eubacteriales bacterium]|nr:YcxB family protein [Eubacteriales bacterium]
MEETKMDEVKTAEEQLPAEEKIPQEKPEPLYRTRTEYSMEEYCRFGQTMTDRMSRIPPWLLIAGIFVLRAVVELVFSHDLPQAVISLIAAVAAAFIFRRLIRHSIEKAYRANAELQGLTAEISFYPDHLETNNRLGSTQLPYNKIYRIFETKTNYYIMMSKNQGIIVVKENCTPELCGFMGELLQKNEKNRVGGKK